MGLPPEAYEKNAKVVVMLDADSGYTCTETHKISADQWGRIIEILNEPATPTDV